MRPIWLIARRELAAYLKGMLGYVIFAVLLVLEGLMFNVWALSSGEYRSAEVLGAFFTLTFGISTAAAVLLTMRLFAEEERDGTLVLLTTAPISDWQIVLGKWLSAFVMVLLFDAMTLHMPLLILVNGHVEPGHLAAGYLGLALVGAATTALGTLASALTRYQVVAGVLGGAFCLGLTLMWMLGKVADPPFDTILSYISLHNKHFMPFMRGSVHLRDVVYYASLAFLALLLTRQIVGARRWR